MKFELKIEYHDDSVLDNLIKEVYFTKETPGKISNKKNRNIVIDKDDPLYIVFKGLDKLTTKLCNINLIDGSMRFIINEDLDNISLEPCSIYCVIENEKYSFY